MDTIAPGSVRMSVVGPSASAWLEMALPPKARPWQAGPDPSRAPTEVTTGQRWTSDRPSRHSWPMQDGSTQSDNALRPGEVAVELPPVTDAGVYFIGTIRTPWRVRSECPKRGSLDGPVCTIAVDARWRQALTDLTTHQRIQVLYWMHQARRDLVLQSPLRTGQTTGSFALRSPVRPNPIASSVVALMAVEGTLLHVRGLDCLDGTPLIDLKPERAARA
jgi:tRNA (adenine37-N6)-methyltransferase